MPVPSLIVVVTAEARASARKGSAMSLMEGGMAPSGLPWYRVVTCTGMTGCSGSHKDSKPNDSALCAMTATSIDRLENVIFTPIFMVPSVYYRRSSLAGVDPPRQTGVGTAYRNWLRQFGGVLRTAIGSASLAEHLAVRSTRAQHLDRQDRLGPFCRQVDLER